ncbi:hypothetical protein HDU97_000578 [Phlyctochytrium planicorne]|nr:hypothetical protein HDU97_000578 [Phlyctochytrium planicorne]
MSFLEVVRSTAILPLVGEECSQTLIQLSPDVIKSPCFSLLISKCLGLGIIVGGSIVKVPQLIKIVQAGSAEGISLVSYLLETFALMVALAYNYRASNPFSTYGEVAFITIQNVAITLLILYYSNRQFVMLFVLVVYQAAMFSLLSEALVNSDLLSLFQWGAILLGTASKLPQILSNFMTGSTGQLSAITMCLQFVGSSARVFTTLREIEDMALIAGSISAAALNAILFFQILLFGNKRALAKEKKE